MPYSYNGWYASSDLRTRPFVIDGREFPAGIVDNDNVFTVLHYVASEFHKRVEGIVAGWNWGYNYRITTGGSSLSNHASGTAIDINAPLHPYGVATSRNFDAGEVTEIRKILAEVEGCVAWGGDYNSQPDAMHFEISADAAEVSRVATKLRNRDKDWFDMATEADLRKIVREELAALEDAEQTVTKPDGKERTMPLRQLRREVWQRLARG